MNGSDSWRQMMGRSSPISSYPNLSRGTMRRMQTQLMLLTFLSVLPPAFSSPPEPKPIDFVDLHLHFDALAGQSVQIEGWIEQAAGSLGFCEKSGRLDPLAVDDSKLTRDERYYLLSNCNQRCRVTAVARLRRIEDEQVIELTRIARPKIKPGEAPAPKDASTDGSRPRVDVIELLLDFEQWKGREVEVHGHLVVEILGDVLLLYQDRRSSSVIFVEGKRLSADERRYLLTQCDPDCSATLLGRPGEVFTQKRLVATALLD